MSAGDSLPVTRRMTRRECLQQAALPFVGGLMAPAFSLAAPAPASVKPKLVAAVVTVYFYNSHADVLLGKILEGWKQDGSPGPALQLAGVYIDQFPAGDIGRAACAKRGVPIFDSIEKAITVGGNSIPVDGVLSIGEHGDYPLNEIGQQLYPRRRFFEEITNTFEKYGKVVPVFNDKHLGPLWSDARWMYDRAKQLQVPFMAGSTMPVGYRLQDIPVPMGTEIESAVGIGFSGLEIYGFHALEFLQWHLERRKGTETGVKSVQFLAGAEMWQAVDSGVVSKDAFEAAFAVVPKSGTPDPRQDDKAAMFLFEYNDGLRAAVMMLSCVGGTSVGLQIKGQAQPTAISFDERTVPRHPHFACLLKSIERMIHTGRPQYPVERTLLTSGILDRVLNSRFQGGKQLQTPELGIAYQPVDYSYAPHIDLLSDPSK